MSGRAAALVLAFVLATASATGVASATTEEWVTVSQPNGLTEDTLDGIREAADRLGVAPVLLQSGSLELTAVIRRPLELVGELEARAPWSPLSQEVSAHSLPIQQAPEGMAYSMSVIALDPGEAVGHWDESLLRSLGPGSLVMSSRSAALRGAVAGDVVDLRGWDGGVHRLRISAVLADEVLGWRELAMSSDVATVLGFERPVAAVLFGPVDSTLATLPAFLPDRPTRTATSDTPPIEDAVAPTILVKERFGEFAFRPRRDGSGIVIDPAWVEENIVSVDLPLLGAFRCNKAIVPVLEAVLEEIEGAGLADEISYSDFQLNGGCYNPRLIRGTTGNSLSRHSWGIAIDINPSSNPYGGEVTMPDSIGEIFRKAGFAWGAGWTYKDGGHFEYKAPLEGPDA